MRKCISANKFEVRQTFQALHAGQQQIVRKFNNICEIDVPGKCLIAVSKSIIEES